MLQHALGYVFSRVSATLESLNIWDDIVLAFVCALCTVDLPVEFIARARQGAHPIICQWSYSDFPRACPFIDFQRNRRVTDSPCSFGWPMRGYCTYVHVRLCSPASCLHDVCDTHRYLGCASSRSAHFMLASKHLPFGFIAFMTHSYATLVVALMAWLASPPADLRSTSS